MGDGRRAMGDGRWATPHGGPHHEGFIRPAESGTTAGHPTPANDA